MICDICGDDQFPAELISSGMVCIRCKSSLEKQGKWELVKSVKWPENESDIDELVKEFGEKSQEKGEK